MARIRTIKPEIWTDEKFGPLDPVTKLVFIGLISQADDAGRILDSVRLIDGLLFAYDDSTSVRRSLDELSRTGLIRRGETSSGQRIIQIAKWDAHQKIDRPNLDAALSPIVKSDNNLREFDEQSTNNRRSLDEDSSVRSTTNDQLPTTNDQRPTSENAHAREAGLEAKVRALYGWEGEEGTDPILTKEFENKEDRDRCLDIALARLDSEGARYQARFFRKILTAVIEEQKHEPAGVGSGTDLSHWED